MLKEELNASDNSWSMLQQPSHASQGITASFRSFLAALDQGWQVREPARVLPTSQVDGWTYRFELVRPAFLQARRIYVPATPAIERFLEQNSIQVVEGNYFDAQLEIG